MDRFPIFFLSTALRAHAVPPHINEHLWTFEHLVRATPTSDALLKKEGRPFGLSATQFRLRLGDEIWRRVTYTPPVLPLAEAIAAGLAFRGNAPRVVHRRAGGRSPFPRAKGLATLEKLKQWVETEAVQTANNADTGNIATAKNTSAQSSLHTVRKLVQAALLQQWVAGGAEEREAWEAQVNELLSLLVLIGEAAADFVEEEEPMHKGKQNQEIVSPGGKENVEDAIDESVTE